MNVRHVLFIFENKKPTHPSFHSGINTFKFPEDYVLTVRRNFLKEEHIKILKTMNEATNRMDMTMFAQAVNLTPNQAMAEVQELAKEGFLRKVGSGFGLTEKGKIALKMFAQIPSEMSFNFYVDVGKPLGFNAQSLKEFYRFISQVTIDSLEFHLYRGDFENWLTEVCKDVALAEAFATLKADGIKGEVLRKALLKAMDERYGIGDLL
jgi:predicted transcriptional regulator